MNDLLNELAALAGGPGVLIQYGGTIIGASLLIMLMFRASAAMFSTHQSRAAGFVHVTASALLYIIICSMLPTMMQMIALSIGSIAFAILVMLAAIAFRKKPPGAAVWTVWVETA